MSSRAIALVIGLSCLGCGSESSSASDTAGSANGAGRSSGGSRGGGDANGTGGLVIVVPPGGSPASNGAGGAPLKLTDVVKTELGGYKRGEPIVPGMTSDGGNVEGNDGCGFLVGVVRDFNSKSPGRHPDFEVFNGAEATKGLVEPMLDADRKPIYASRCEAMPDPASCPDGQQTTSKEAFDQWYRDVPGTNHPFLLYFEMEPVGNVVSFQSDNFVPVDGVGFDDSWQALDGMQHNYGFTTELHVQFKYSGGETFRFVGDDDVWAFINGKLAIDLGGLHEARTDQIALDDRAAEFGLEKGNVYPLDLFQAERHSTGSHYRIDSTLSLVDCGTIPKPR